MSSLWRPIKQRLLQNNFLLFTSAFLLWVLPFHGFLTGKLALTADAISYYDHTKFFIDSMQRGVFPLWDPLWFCGFPNDFFLRRVNPYNPFLFIVFFLHLIGLKTFTAYVIFLIFYFFLASIGFYRCAKIIFRDRTAALMAFVLFLFSPLGPRIFDSYLMLVITPMVWFFYFLLAFHHKSKSPYALGMTFAAMLLMNTYIPFYFIIIFFFFVLALLVSWPRVLKDFLKNFFSWGRKNPAVLLFCLVALTLAVIPGITFFMSAEKSEIVMPIRHSLSLDHNALSVEAKWITGWGTLEELLYANYFPRLKDVDYALFRIPIFMLLLLSLGIITPMRRKMGVLFLWGLGLFILSTPKAFPLYTFLYQHVFFFKYFKNLQFFLLLGILPIFCMFLAGQWQSLVEYQPPKRSSRILYFLFVGLVHVGLGTAFVIWGDRNISSYLTLLLSLLFFLGVAAGALEMGGKLFPWLVLLLVGIQPLEINLHLTANTPPYTGFQYDQPYEFQDLVRRNSSPLPLNPALDYKPTPLYVASRGFNWLYENIPPAALGKIIWHKFILYDQASFVPENDPMFLRLAENLTGLENRALISDPSGVSETIPPAFENIRPLFLEENSETFRLVAADANSARIRMNFPVKKFLVYTDSFDDRWQAWINGKKIPLYKVDVGFKGLWVNSGEQEIIFRFGKDQDYFFNYFLMILFYGTFCAVWMHPRTIRLRKNS